ncbi:acyl-CoA dehydrogenase family protein [Shewanella sp. 202IG2-18]|uniref:acyl-CoA dehydrogenase family protein n=1 Tax=Parashewanella hymeniacidonis TaxID=2807618 RepID=UPI00196112A4|nr:acyl-CoA dehydrogenase family protein [Parashewanella hymeniacidonis]MBM7073252.1 acyl-CoA dehydrogenase family protein [Parashewanella hymeniacidonis]
MYPYQAPINEMEFLLNDVFDADNVWQQLPKFENVLDSETASAILSEASKLSEELIAPLNRNSDEQGVKLIDKTVITPDGFKAAYKEVAAGGWVGLCGNDEFQGMGMPKMLGVLADEMFYSASNSFTLYNSLTSGAALCIESHGSEKLKNFFLPKMYSGEWAGAMAMTEAHAGSDLRHLKTTAVKQDEHYLISGSKIFITAGEHDLAENIVHLVLAKIKGQNSLSLFVVPKFHCSQFQGLGEFNNVTVGAIEHKMGLHGSATCVMHYEGSAGYLIGVEGKGLACMFTMMNYERLAIGIQGLANSEFAYQLASKYSKERVQGSAVSPSGEKISASALVHHGDVRRTLLNIRCLTEAGRALSVFTAKQLDLSKYAQGERQTNALNLALLLTPITKAFFTDRGLENAIAAQQVFGGHGYIRETGIEQIVRDSRIAQIYEGTNGIQALDFLGRKVVKDELKSLKSLLHSFSEDMHSFKMGDDKKINQLQQLFSKLENVGEQIAIRSKEDANLINFNAVNYLDAAGYIIYGYFWLLMLEKSVDSQQVCFETKSILCEYYFDTFMPKAAGLLEQLSAMKTEIMNLEVDKL